MMGVAAVGAGDAAVGGRAGSAGLLTHLPPADLVVPSRRGAQASRV